MSMMSTAREATARALLSVLRRLPIEVQAIVKTELQPIGSLDYPSAKLAMAVGSPWQAYRLFSCRKEPETVAWLERNLREDDCFYDLGANVGAYSLVAFAVMRGHGRVIAFEPGFSTYPELCRNVHLNAAQDCITPLAIALGEKTELLTLRYSDVTAGAARHDWTGRDGSEAFALHTPCYRLDDVIATLGLPPPTVLKLDVDGPEHEVLRGAAVTLASPSLRTCLVELDASAESYDDSLALLREAGLRIESRHMRGTAGSTFNLILTRG